MMQVKRSGCFLFKTVRTSKPRFWLGCMVLWLLIVHSATAFISESEKILFRYGSWWY